MSNTIRVQITHTTDYAVTPAELVKAFPDEWKALTDDKVIELGYAPWERFAVFLNDVIDGTYVGGFHNHPGVTESRDDFDYDWPWRRDDAEALDEALRSTP